MKPSRWQTLATSLYDGTGTGGVPRYREGIIAELARALEGSYDEGALAGAAAARERVLRESLAIARGMEQGLAARVRDLELEVAAHVRSAGKVTT